MDRAQELRSLMKFASKRDDSKSTTNLSGKDKAKMLKLMKEKQKNVAVETSMVTKSTFVSRSNSSVGFKPTPSIKISGPPADFFDNNSATITTTTMTTPTFKPSDITSSINTQRAVTTLETPSGPVPAAANMPVGFFDNPTEELSARGINIQQHNAEQQKIVESEFQSFLSEIEVLKEDADEVSAEVHVQEAAGRDLEEEALQMAYMAKLAELYRRSDAVVDKEGRVAASAVASSHSAALKTDDIHELLGSNSSGFIDDGSSAAASNIGNNSSSSSGDGPAVTGVVSAVREDVERVLYRKLQLDSLRKRRLQQASAAILEADRKRKRLGESGSGDCEQQREDEEHGGESESSSSGDEDSDEDDYSPLEFMDCWTHKSGC